MTAHSAELIYILVDARQMTCPMPVLLLKKAIKQSPTQCHFLVKCTDANSLTDIPQFCKVHQYQVVDQKHEHDEFHFFIHTAD